MNCRKVSSLLSAYIDRELTGAEMLEIRAHVDHCPSCRAEQESLLQTKQLLSALAYHTPRAELEQILVVHAEREVNPPLLSRILPPEWTDAMLWRWEGIGNLGTPRMRPLAATAMLSLAGLCLATASVSGPDEESTLGMPPAHAFAVYVSPTDPLTRVPVTPVISDMENSSPVNATVPVAFSTSSTNSETGPVWGTMATPCLSATEGTGGGWNEDDLILPTPQQRAMAGYFGGNRPRTYSLSVMIVSRPH